MKNFRAWYLRNEIPITWFLIGVLFQGGLAEFARGNVSGYLLLWGIAVINCIFVKKA